MTKGPNSDIQAVILCGPGHGLDPIIDEETSPKCLLPIANKPLLYYPITWLHQSGISGIGANSFHRTFTFLDIILVAHKSLYSRLTQLVKLQISEGASHVEIVLLDSMGTGTMDALRAVRPRLHSDFVLLSCDLITETPLYKMIDQHRTNSALVTVMLAANKAAAGGKAEDASRYSDIEDTAVFAGMDESRKKLLYLIGKADIDETVDFRMSLLYKFPCILLRTNLTDSHCYIFKKEFLEMLDSGAATGKRNIYSVREELIPRLVRKQKPEFGCREPVETADRSKTNYTCAVRLIDGEFCLRVNNLKHYTEANRFMGRTLPQTAARISPSADVNPKAQIGSDSLVGDFSKVGEKTSVKRSTIGSNAVIGKNVKISNCIIMDKVVIEDNCKLENCIISLCAHVGEKTSLKDCDVGPNYHISADSSLKGECLSNRHDL